MDTVTIYRDWYNELQDRQFHDSSELAYIQGTIRALASMDDNTDFVMQSLKSMAKKIELGVDISSR